MCLMCCSLARLLSLHNRRVGESLARSDAHKMYGYFNVSIARRLANRNRVRLGQSALVR
jgi:hypothetical protein